MKLLGLFGLIILALLQAHVLAANATESAAASIPACGLKCIVSLTTTHSDCEVTNTTCVCLNVELNKLITACVRSNCTVREGLAVLSYSKHSCNAPSRDRTALVRDLGIIFLALGLFAFVLRILAKIRMGWQTWGADDWVICVAVAMMIPLNVLSIPISQYLGKDMWNVPVDDISDFLYIFFWDELLYLGVLPITKISIILFYLRVFPRKEIRLACHILIGFNVAYFIAFELVSIFQCTPIQGAWREWDKEFPATCRNINMQGWMAAVFNIILDLATLILPLPELYKLSLSRAKKVQTMLMFSVGFFVTVVSIVRLQSLASYATTSNITQDYVEIGYWSTIEVPVGIICACMPAIRSLFAFIFPKVFASTVRSKSKASYANISGQTPSSTSKTTTPKHTVNSLHTGFTTGSRGADYGSEVELTDIRYSDHEDRNWAEKNPTLPREPV